MDRAAMGIGEKIREVRERQGLMVSEVARRAGLTVSGVTSIETGRVKRPAVQTVISIAHALGISPDLLLQEELVGKKFVVRVEKADDPTLQHQVRLERAVERFVADIGKEARRAKLEEVEHCVTYATGRAEYYEQELERGRTKDYATYKSAYNLAVLAADEFSSFSGWLLDHGPARPLLAEMERGVGLELVEEYDALITALIERTSRTQCMLFANAEDLAVTEAERDEIAAKRQETDNSNAKLARRSA